MNKMANAAFLVIALCAAPAAAFDQSHQAWTDLLAAHVRNGHVDYAALKRGPGLAAYLAQLESVTPKQLTAFSKEQKLAFWLNVYNAYTVKLVVDNFPLESIRDIGVLPFAAFKKEFIEVPATGEEEVSLDFIEHQIVRKQFTEPRVHFALVCGARSCPPLRSEAYRATHLDRQLDDQARRFFQDRGKNRWDPKTSVLHISKILDWFKGDFTKSGASIAEVVARYIDGLEAAAVKEIKYVDYDWSLNGK